MCLETIKKIVKNRKYHIAWKFIEVDKHNFISYYRDYQYGYYNIEASSTFLYSEKSGKYPAGFHCFFNKKDAESLLPRYSDTKIVRVILPPNQTITAGKQKITIIKKNRRIYKYVSALCAQRMIIPELKEVNDNVKIINPATI